jgi:mono/diheme cytochrome c family protein
MRRGSSLIAASAVAVIGGALLYRGLKPSSEAGADPQWSVIERYCFDCHNDDDVAGGVSFKKLDRQDLGRHAKTWEAAVRKLRAGLMPPKGERRPARAVLDATANWLAHDLDAAWARAPNPGTKPLARLNRTEYTNAIRDLLDYEPGAIAASLPADVSVGGFDNIAAALSVSPTLLEGYALAAMQIGRRAVGDLSMGHTEVRYAASGGSAQQHHIEGLPLGTRGGIDVEHNFPLDAVYELAVQASLPSAGWDNPTGRLVWCDGPSVHVAFNGAPVELDARRRVRLRVPAGPQRITAALVDDRRCAGVNELYLGEIELGGAVGSLMIDGPYDATGAGDTPSRRAIFTCRPKSAADAPQCAEQILVRLATRAYRHPVAPGDDELGLLMQFYRLGREEGGTFEVGIQYALSRMLVDPHFLYRFEREPEDVAPGAAYRIDDLAFASRLSFFLWSSIPDDELLAAATAGRLHDPDVLATQVERMLADARSQRLVENFTGQWLKLRELPDFPSQDPAYDAQLREAFEQETELFFADVLRERRSVLTLLDADYTFLNERLAEHYGIDGVRGTYMRRVALPSGSPRGGLLGQGSLLTATSAPNRTSPVVRGQWIVQNLLGAAVPNPPPGAAADLAKEATATSKLKGDTVRERLEMHRANPTCAACHAIMDPLGLALENFDLVGRWREQEDGHAIDASTEMTDGTALASPADLKRALLSRSDAFIAALTERLMTYALGRELDYYDQPVVRGVVRAAVEQGTTLEALIQAIVASDAFQKRVKGGMPPTDSTLQAAAVARAKPAE